MLAFFKLGTESSSFPWLGETVEEGPNPSSTDSIVLRGM